MRILTRQEVKTSRYKEESAALARLSALTEAIHKKEKELASLEEEHEKTIERIDREITQKLNQLRQT